MRLGWAPVLEAAAKHQSHCSAFRAKALSEFMHKFFEGVAYSVEQWEALFTGTAGLFVVSNLFDPVQMIEHQCLLLHQTSPILRGVLKLESTSSGRAISLSSLLAQSNLGSAEPSSTEVAPAGWQEQIRKPEHQSLRQQLVTMLIWLVRLREVFYKLDTLVQHQMRCQPNSTIVGVRLGTLHCLAKHLSQMVQVCCRTDPQSTLVDVLTENLVFINELDHHQLMPTLKACQRELMRSEARSFVSARAQYVLDLGNHLPLILRWFTASPTERKSLAVKYGLLVTLQGFDVPSGERSEKQMIHDASHSGRFCARAMELLELLVQMNGAKTTSDHFADALLILTGGSGRQARRNPELQRGAKKASSLVSAVAARFTSLPELREMCSRRQRHFGALVSIFDKLIEGLRVAMKASGLPSGQLMCAESVRLLSQHMPDWNAHDLHETSAHVIGLTDLAVEVNGRMREAFGGNFPALVWQRDCYEFDPAHDHKDMQLLGENEFQLQRTVQLLSIIVEDGSFARGGSTSVSAMEADGGVASSTGSEGKARPRKHKGKKG